MHFVDYERIKIQYSVLLAGGHHHNCLLFVEAVDYKTAITTLIATELKLSKKKSKQSSYF